MKSLILSFSVLVLFTSCAKKEATFDATGSFEADEIIISSEVMGKILYLAIEEGKNLKQGELIGIIDTSTLFLKKKQLIALNAELEEMAELTEELKAQKAEIEKLLS